MGGNDERTVRRATAQDIEALVDLRTEMFRAMGTIGAEDPRWQEAGRQWFVDRIDESTVCLAVALTGQRVVASAMGAIRDAMPSPTVPGGRDVLVSNVCTFADVRGRGHGRAAFEYVMTWARATGIGRAELMATQDGRSMYEAAGFAVVAYPAMRSALR